MREFYPMAFIAVAAISAPASAQSARDLLVSAAFTAPDKSAALTKIAAALGAADMVLARDPGNREARLQRALATGYRGKLKRNRHDAQSARTQFEALATAHPRDPEAQIALAGWHLGAIIELGPLPARTGLGARKERGLQALGAALAAGGGRALFPAVAGFNRIMLDPKDIAAARTLCETAVKARIARPEDRVMQRNAATLLPLLRPGNGKAAAAMAHKLMPFGRLAR